MLKSIWLYIDSILYKTNINDEFPFAHLTCYTDHHYNHHTTQIENYRTLLQPNHAVCTHDEAKPTKRAFVCFVCIYLVWLQRLMIFDQSSIVQGPSDRVYSINRFCLNNTLLETYIAWNFLGTLEGPKAFVKTNLYRAETTNAHWSDTRRRMGKVNCKAGDP